MPDPEPQQSVELAADEDQAEGQGSKEAKRRSEELRQKKERIRPREKVGAGKMDSGRLQAVDR